MSSQNNFDAVKYIRSPQAIRERCQQIYQLALNDRLKNFKLDLSKLGAVCDFVVEIIKRDYPDLKIPYHGRNAHFESRQLETLERKLASFSPLERARSKFDLILVSVLLDAGAGMSWGYTNTHGVRYTKSEGLAVASLDAFMLGKFCENANCMKVESRRLRTITSRDLAEIFQVSDQNPLVGLEGRAKLLQRLGEVLESQNETRPAAIFDRILSSAQQSRLPATTIFGVILEFLAPIWPSRLVINQQNLGDVWQHSKIEGLAESNQLVPFHKLTQWLTYSLIEIFENYGIEVFDLDHLTGLPEYRNGGLFIDMGVLKVADGALEHTYQVDSEFIVEWRALTVCLLDLVAEKIRTRIGKTKQEFPLARVLQGGTWSAGREIAKKLRADGAPPVKVLSDGTVF